MTIASNKTYRYIDLKNQDGSLVKRARITFLNLEPNVAAYQNNLECSAYAADKIIKSTKPELAGNSLNCERFHMVLNLMREIGYDVERVINFN